MGCVLGLQVYKLRNMVTENPMEQLNAKANRKCTVLSDMSGSNATMNNRYFGYGALGGGFYSLRSTDLGLELFGV